MGTRDFPWRHQSIALVGNASSLRESSFGPDIDAHECVVRINQGAFVPLYPESTGVRTDVLFLTLNGIAVEKAWMYVRARRKAHTVVGMSPHKRRVFGVDLKHLIHVYPEEWHRELHEQMGARPSTGAMAVDLLRRTVDDVAQISVYGFDFWGSPTTYTGIAQAAPHDPVAEEAFVRNSLRPGAVHMSPTRKQSDG